MREVGVERERNKRRGVNGTREKIKEKRGGTGGGNAPKAEMKESSYFELLSLPLLRSGECALYLILLSLLRPFLYVTIYCKLSCIRIRFARSLAISHN